MLFRSAVVAAAGFLLARRGPIVLDEVFALALAAHREVQPRGSGADIAAATFGGALIVRMGGTGLSHTPVELPRGLVLRAFALPRAARTSDALDRLASREGVVAVERAMGQLIEAAHAGAGAVRAGDLQGFLDATTHHVDGLAALGDALDLPLVPPEIVRARDVLRNGAPDPVVLLPSGAGGGDTVLLLSARAPTDHEENTLQNLGLHPYPLGLATCGVHVVPFEG